MPRNCVCNVFVVLAIVASCGCERAAQDESTVVDRRVASKHGKGENMTTFLALHSCNLGDAVRRGTNPFTGEPVEFHIDEGLSESEREAVKRLLSEFHAKGPDADGYYQVTFNDETSVNVGAGPLDGSIRTVGMAFEIEGPVTADVLRFAHRLAVAGNMSVGSAIDPDIVALVAVPQNPRVRERWPQAVVLESEDTFFQWTQAHLEIKAPK
jgi:hypothetical protein